MEQLLKDSICFLNKKGLFRNVETDTNQSKMDENIYDIFTDRQYYYFFHDYFILLAGFCKCIYRDKRI